MGATMGKNPWVGESHQSLCCPLDRPRLTLTAHETGTLAVGLYLSPNEGMYTFARSRKALPSSTSLATMAMRTLPAVYRRCASTRT